MKTEEAPVAVAKENVKETPKAPKSTKLAAVLIRSGIGVNPDVKTTLDMLKLRKKHVCVIVDDNKVNRGMMMKVKDYVAWGEVDSAIIKELSAKKPDAKFFSMHPPRGGFEKKGIKVPFTKGGALGYRGDKMPDLLRKML